MYLRRLKDLRTDAEKTQEDIADILHCKREVYRRYEKGKPDIPIWALIKIADYYETTTDYLLDLASNRSTCPTSPDMQLYSSINESNMQYLSSNELHHGVILYFPRLRELRRERKEILDDTASYLFVKREVYR